MSRSSPSTAYGNAERAEYGLDRAANPVVSGHDDPDPLGRHSAASERQHLLADELERAAAPGALEEADHSVERRRVRRIVGEQRAFEVRKRGRRDGRVVRSQLFDRLGREPGEILGRPPECAERGPSRLVRERDGDIGAGGERLEESPLRAGQILEAVRENRLAAPRVEIRAEALDGVIAKQAVVPPFEPVELSAVAGVESPQLAVDRVGAEEPVLELAERPLERVDEARMSRRACKPVELRAADDPADEKRLLRAAERAAPVRRARCDAAEQIFEGVDRAAEQRGPASQQLALDAVDVRPVRHDEHRLGPFTGAEHVEITAEQKLDLARVCGPRDEAERHPPTLALHSAGEELRSTPVTRKLRQWETRSPIGSVQ